MKHTISWHWLERGLIILISLLLIFSGVVLLLRPRLMSTDSEVSPTKTVGAGRIAADGFTTVFTLADNAAQAAKDYQDHLLFRVVPPLAVGVIGLLYAGAHLIYCLIFKLKPKRGTYRIALGAVIAIWVGIGGLNLFNAIDVQHISDCARLQNIYDSKKHRITEGIVHVSYQSLGAGHGENGDIIQVGPLQLEVDPYKSTCAYKKIIAFGGVLTEGTYARIYYTDYRTILRIDVKKQ